MLSRNSYGPSRAGLRPARPSYPRGGTSPPATSHGGEEGQSRSPCREQLQPNSHGRREQVQPKTAAKARFDILPCRLMARVEEVQPQRTPSARSSNGGSDLSIGSGDLPHQYSIVDNEVIDHHQLLSLSPSPLHRARCILQPSINIGPCPAREPMVASFAGRHRVMPT